MTNYVVFVRGCHTNPLLERLATFPFSNAEQQTDTITQADFTYFPFDKFMGVNNSADTKADAMKYMVRLLRKYPGIEVLTVSKRVSSGGRLTYLSTERHLEIYRMMSLPSDTF